MPPTRKNGTSEPSVGRGPVQVGRRRAPGRASGSRATSVAAASLLPPPSPAAAGIRFSSAIATPADRAPIARPPATRPRPRATRGWCDRAAAPGCVALRGGTARATRRTCSTSWSASDWNTVRSSWNPSARRDTTRRSRLILAEGRKVSAAMPRQVDPGSAVRPHSSIRPPTSSACRAPRPRCGGVPHRPGVAQLVERDGHGVRRAPRRGTPRPAPPRSARPARDAASRRTARSAVTSRSRTDTGWAPAGALRVFGHQVGPHDGREPPRGATRPQVGHPRRSQVERRPLACHGESPRSPSATTTGSPRRAGACRRA